MVDIAIGCLFASFTRLVYAPGLFTIARQGNEHQVAVGTRGVIVGDIVLGNDGGRVGTVVDHRCVAFAHDKIAAEAGEYDERCERHAAEECGTGRQQAPVIRILMFHTTLAATRV